MNFYLLLNIYSEKEKLKIKNKIKLFKNKRYE